MRAEIYPAEEEATAQIASNWWIPHSKDDF
jgi:hypothetical protein